MKRLILQLLICVAGITLCQSAGAQSTIKWVTTKTDAFNQAREQEKKVFLLYGRDVCGNCNAVKRNCETDAIKAIINRGYVLWYVNCDDKTSAPESYKYISKAFANGSVSLPVLCIFDPKDEANILELTTGYKNADALKEMMEKHIPAQTATTNNAEQSSWLTSKTEAFAKAKKENKKVYVLYGRDACGNCSSAKKICATEEIKALIGKGYVLWYSCCDKTNEAYQYVSEAFKKGNAMLPYLAVVDPNTDKTENLTTGYQTLAAIKQVLEKCMPKNIATTSESNETTTQSSWVTTKTEAFNQAREQEKKIFLLYGRDACGNCNAVKRSCETDAIKAIINRGYVLWYVNCDDKTSAPESYKYISKAFANGSFMLPALCIFDPKDESNILELTTGFQKADALKEMMEKHISAQTATTNNTEQSSWLTSKTEAFTKAKKQNKMVFLLYGRDNCSNCKSVKASCEGSTLKPELEKGFILWYANCENSTQRTEANKYISKAYHNGSVSLPVLAVINPNSESVVELTTGYMNASQLMIMINSAQSDDNSNTIVQEEEKPLYPILKW